MSKKNINLTPLELAKRLGVGRNAIYEMRREGRLPEGVKFGSRRLFPIHQLVNYSNDLAKLFKQELATSDER